MISFRHTKITVLHRPPHVAAFLTALTLLVLGVSTRGQEPAAANPQPSPAGPTSSSKATKHRHTPFDDFLVRGSVFNEKALAIPGADIRIRRVGEKKFHWRDVTNSRGDFAIRVPYNASYEILTHVKGFVDQSKTVEAKQGSDQNLSFQMQPAQGKK